VEKRTVSKVFWRLMPFLGLLYARHGSLTNGFSSELLGNAVRSVE
jgi:hypothetical protein